jgi:hypothetical protein
MRRLRGLLYSIAAVSTATVYPFLLPAQDTTAPAPTHESRQRPISAAPAGAAGNPLRLSLYANYQNGATRAIGPQSLDVDRAYLTFRATPGSTPVRITADVQIARDTTRDQYCRVALRAKYAGFHPGGVGDELKANAGPAADSRHRPRRAVLAARTLASRHRAERVLPVLGCGSSRHGHVPKETR